MCTYTVEYRQSAPHRLSAPPPPPPIFPHRKNWYCECAPPRLSAPPPFSERPLSRYLASDERPPSRYLASDAPTMHNEVPKCADYSLGLHARRSRHDRRSRPVCVVVTESFANGGGPNIFVNVMSPHNYNATCRLQLFSMAAVRACTP